jgi:hypothetical protein
VTEFFIHGDRRAQDQKLVNIYEQLLKNENGHAVLKERSHIPMDE